MAEHEPCIGATDDWMEVRDALHYDPQTGIFRWKRDVSNVKAGSVAGSPTAKGYLNIRFQRRQYLAHRLAWFWMKGEWPPGLLDHADTDRRNNRWSNLRCATNAENLLNRGRNSNNRTGYKGVSYNKKVGRYEASLTINRKRRFLGYFPTAEAACSAYRAAIQAASPSFWRD